MRRWVALSVSLGLHSLLFLLPGSAAKSAEEPPALRVMLHGSAHTSPGRVGEPRAEAHRKDEALSVPETAKSVEAVASEQKKPPEQKKTPELKKPAELKKTPELKKNPVQKKTPVQKKISEPKKTPEPKKRPEAAPPAKAKSEPVPKQPVRAVSTASPSPSHSSDPAEFPAPPGSGAGGKTTPRSGEKAASLTAATSSRDGTVDVETLTFLSRATPEYPLFSRKRREEGAVHLVLTIRSGKVADAKVSESSGFSRLDDSALYAVKRWRFDQRGEVKARVRIVFRLST